MFAAHPIKKCFTKIKKANKGFSLSGRHEERNFSPPQISSQILPGLKFCFLKPELKIWLICILTVSMRYLNSTWVSRRPLKLSMTKTTPNLPRLITSVSEINALFIPQARHLSLSSHYFPYPSHPQVLLVSASRNFIYLFFFSSPMPLPWSKLSLSLAMISLPGLSASIFPSLFLYMVARERFKIPINCVTPMLKPFSAFSLLLRWPSILGVICPCLLLWPHLSPLFLLSRHTDFQCSCPGPCVVLLSLNAPKFVSSPVSLPSEFLSSFMVGWLTHSQETWSSQNRFKISFNAYF